MDHNDRKIKYQGTFSRHGESSKSLMWLSYSSAALRYRELVADLNIEGKTLLDVGCGMGDLLPYFYAKTSNFHYTGVDITPEFIEVAKKRYGGHKFLVGNPFEEPMSAKYDIVLCSGVLNHNVPDWLEARKKMITCLYELANETLVFNMAGGLGDLPKSEMIVYADPMAILEFCKTLSTRVALKTDYHPRDFTISINKSSVSF